MSTIRALPRIVAVLVRLGLTSEDAARVAPMIYEALSYVVRFLVTRCLGDG